MKKTRKKKITKPISLKKKTTTDRRALAYKKIVENRGKTKSVGKVLKDAGYSDSYAKNPQQFLKTKKWTELQEHFISDFDLARVHGELLRANSIDHAVFPLGLKDEDIMELLDSVNCVVKRFMHGDTQTHVWFWSPDNRARKDALDMAYKCKGKYAAVKIEDTNPLAKLSNAELAEKRKILLKFLLKK